MICRSLKKRCTDTTKQLAHLPQEGPHLMTFMVRGLCTSFKFGVAHFACKSLTAEQLSLLIWQAVRTLESYRFCVLAETGDRASTNRKFFKLHSLEKTASVTYKTLNPYLPDGRFIYFFSDVPHLIKTVKNCWSNSYAHSNTRKLWVSAKK